MYQPRCCLPPNAQLRASLRSEVREAAATNAAPSAAAVASAGPAGRAASPPTLAARRHDQGPATLLTYPRRSRTARGGGEVEHGFGRKGRITPDSTRARR